MTIERFHGKQLHVYLPSLNVMRILTIASFDVLLFIDKAFYFSLLLQKILLTIFLPERAANVLAFESMRSSKLNFFNETTLAWHYK